MLMWFGFITNVFVIIKYYYSSTPSSFVFRVIPVPVLSCVFIRFPLFYYVLHCRVVLHHSYITRVGFRKKSADVLFNGLCCYW